MKRLNTGKRVRTKLGLQLRGKLKPATVHQEFRILRRILNVAVKKRRLALNPCSGVEFPVSVSATTRKPHYLTLPNRSGWSRQHLCTCATSSSSWSRWASGPTASCCRCAKHR
jgi:hypothetical protein